MTDDVKELQEYVTRLERSERARMNHSSLERLEDVGAELVMMGLAVTEMQGWLNTMAKLLLDARNPKQERRTTSPAISVP